MSNKWVETYLKCPNCGYEFERCRFKHEEDLTITKGEDEFRIIKLKDIYEDIHFLYICPECSVIHSPKVYY